MIRAVTLDAGGTLIEPWPSVGHIYAAEAARHGWPGLSPAALNRAFNREWSARGSAFDHTDSAWAALVDRTFGDQVGVPPSRSFFRELYARFAQPDVWRVFPDVGPTLAALREAGVKVGLLSNWDARLRTLLEALGLAAAFEVVVVSCEIGARKPDRRLFTEAARRLGLAPSEILHVGDDPLEDTRGGCLAGCVGRTLVRDLSKATPGGCADIHSLLEIPGIVAFSRQVERRCEEDAQSGGS